MGPRHRLVAALLAGAAVVAGCGVQGDGAPRALSPDAVPDELLAPSTSTPPQAEPETGQVATVYLVDNRERLRAVERTPAAFDSSPDGKSPPWGEAGMVVHLRVD